MGTTLEHGRRGLYVVSPVPARCDRDGAMIIRARATPAEARALAAGFVGKPHLSCANASLEIDRLGVCRWNKYPCLLSTLVACPSRLWRCRQLEGCMRYTASHQPAVSPAFFGPHTREIVPLVLLLPPLHCRCCSGYLVAFVASSTPLRLSTSGQSNRNGTSSPRGRVRR